MVRTLHCFIETVFSVIFIVPQMLAMMVDIEDEPEWSASDDPDDDDCDRYLFIITRSGSNISMFLAGSPIFITAYLSWYKLNQSHMAQINTCGWVSYHKIRVGRSDFWLHCTIIILKTHAILARYMISPQAPGENRVAWSIASKKIVGSAEKIRSVGEPEPHVLFFSAWANWKLLLRIYYFLFCPHREKFSWKQNFFRSEQKCLPTNLTFLIAQAMCFYMLSSLSTHFRQLSNILMFQGSCMPVNISYKIEKCSLVIPI